LHFACTEKVAVNYQTAIYATLCLTASHHI
jgi:hypothetical protein